MLKHDKGTVNAYIMALFVFQFGFLQPIASAMNTQAPIAVFTIVLVLIALIHNKFRFKQYVIMFLFVVGVFFLTSVIVLSSDEVVLIFVEFLAKGVPAFIIAGLPTDSAKLYNAFLVVAVVNVFAIGLFPFVNFLDSMNYMRFGYAMLPSVIMFIYAVLDPKTRNLPWITAAIVSASLMIIFGARGTIVALALLPVFLFVSLRRISIGKKVFWLVFIAICLFFVLRFNLLIRVLDYIYFDLGLQTYAVAKLRTTMIQGLAAASSGRMRLYSRLGSLVWESPVIGHGVGIAQRAFGYTSHNVFLQILAEGGLIGLVFWGLIWIFCSVEYVHIDQIQRHGFYRVVTMLGAISIGRLLVSSDLWLRPEYWFFISMLFNSASSRKKSTGRAPIRQASW